MGKRKLETKRYTSLGTGMMQVDALRKYMEEYELKLSPPDPPAKQKVDEWDDDDEIIKPDPELLKIL